MMFPEDPKKRPRLWDDLSTQLANEPICRIISNGNGDVSALATMLSVSDAEELLNRLRAYPICRVSSGRGGAISPHFAATLIGREATVTELLMLPAAGMDRVGFKQLQATVETVVINLLFATEDIESVVVPLPLQPWLMRDATLQPFLNGLRFARN